MFLLYSSLDYTKTSFFVLPLMYQMLPIIHSCFFFFWKRRIVRPPLRAQTALIGNTAHFEWYNLSCLQLTSRGEAELRGWVSESRDSVMVSPMKIVSRWCQRHLGFFFFFYLRAGCSVHCLTSSTAPWMWLSPDPPADWCGLLSSGPQLQTMHGGLSCFLWSRTWTSLKVSFWKEIRGQIKLWVSCFWWDRVHISAQQNTEQRYRD